MKPLFAEHLNQKDVAMLWAVLRPHHFSRLVQDYCEIHLGLMEITDDAESNIQAVIPTLKPSTPCVLISSHEYNGEFVMSILFFLTLNLKLVVCFIFKLVCF